MVFKEKSNHTLFCLRHDVLVCLFLIMATLAVYWQVQNHDFVNFDDNEYVYDNHHVRNGLTLEGISWAFTATHAGNWHPLTWLSHMLDCQLYGLNPGRHHLTNLLFHIANTLLLFYVFRKMTGGLWQSAFVAALFALHPLHVESVAWVSERKDVLSTFFWILTMWAYIRYAEHPAAGKYLWVVLFFTLGLMSKPMLVTLPFVLLLLDYWPLNRLQIDLSNTGGSYQKRSRTLYLIWEKVPLFVLAVISSSATFYAEKHGGTVASLDVITLKARIANALVAYIKYIVKMIYPVKLAFFYPHPEMLPWWQIIGALLVLVAISFTAIKLIKQSPFFAVGWLWYLGTLVPVIGLVQVGIQSMADRYTYVPHIGLFIIIVWGLPELLAHWKQSKMWLAALATISLSIIMAVTWKQATYWQNSITLFKHALKVTSNNFVPHMNLGSFLLKQGRAEEAIEHYKQALKIKPDYAEAHYNLGTALVRMGRVDEAIAQFRTALQINPGYADTHVNLGGAFIQTGRIDEAIVHFRKALQIKPFIPEVHVNLGVALANKGKLEDAVTHFRKALHIDPGNTEAQDNLNQAMVTLEKIDREIKYIQSELMLAPDDSMLNYNLGNLYKMKGQMNRAIDYYTNALSLQPEFPEVIYELAKLHVGRGEYEKALSLYDKMIAILPDDPVGYYNVACIYARQNKPEESVAWLKKAVTQGLNDWEHIKNDKDLDNIRNSLPYTEFIKNY